MKLHDDHPIRWNVLIAENRKLLREGLCALLVQYPEVRVVGEVEDARAALAQYKALSADVLVITAMAASGGGLDMVRAIAEAAPSLRLIVLTVDPSPQFLRGLLGTGVHGCLNKDSSATELVDAVRAVMAGGTYVSPKLLDVMASAGASADAELKAADQSPSAAAAAVVGAVTPLPPPATRPLAPREREILRRIAGGESTKQIARSLGVGTKTVETHRRRLMHKLNKHTVAELTKYAVIHGLTPLEVV
jgi:DNA-binding NarL/FixJ family response regulator